MIKKFKTKAIITLSFIINAILVLTIMSSALFSLAEAAYTINKTSFTATFTNTADSQTYELKCYTIAENSNYVAIAWSKKSTNVMPANLVIPNTIDHSGSKTIVAIAKGGFRNYPTLESITLPATIEEIHEEAFAYDMGLTSFKIPYLVTAIAPSTFLDCRKLENFYYSDSENNQVTYNERITYIGDHAFDSCINLKAFNCPSPNYEGVSANNALRLGKSCFQKCSSIPRVTFPNDNGKEGVLRNTITIESFAFADCKNLDSIYFDTNVTTVQDYAFANSKKGLTIKYTGGSIPGGFSSKWRNRYITTSTTAVPEGYTVEENETYSTALYALQLDAATVIEPGGYDGFTFTIESSTLKLDNARTNNTSIYFDPKSYYDSDLGEEEETDYACIYQFIPPDHNTPYYNTSTKVLTLPDRITIGENQHYYVRVVKADACNNDECQTALRGVVFNEHLVQIQHRSFFHCTNISSLNFNNCKYLEEIGYSIFQEVDVQNGKNREFCSQGDALPVNQQTYNSVLTQIKLPNCLEYLGNFAFYNFINLIDGIYFKTDNSKPSQLKLIGDYAFSVIARSDSDRKGFNPSKTIEIELPYSLDDSYAPLANTYSSFSYATTELPVEARYAVGKNAFDNQQVVGCVKM